VFQDVTLRSDALQVQKNYSTTFFSVPGKLLLSVYYACGMRSKVLEPGFCTRGKSWSGEWVSGVTRVKIPTGGCPGIHLAPVANPLRCWVDGYAGCFWFVMPCILLVPT